MSKKAVIELQLEAINKNSSISTLVRMAYVIAKKLKLSEFEEWLHYELNGYHEYVNHEWPSYRIIPGELRGWNPYHGWIPVIIKETIMYDNICKQKVMNAISSFEEMLNSDVNEMMVPLNPKTNDVISRATRFDTNYCVFIDRTIVQSICDSVRNLVLEWSLKLEEEGIEGEGMVFKKEEQQKAKELRYTVNNFYGDINQSQFQQNTHSSNQILSSFESNCDEIKHLLKELKLNYKSISLEDDKVTELEDAITLLEKQVTNNNYGKKEISSILMSIRKIIEDTTSSLVSAGLLYMISQILT